MDVKTKDGKYFSELGSWSDLFRALVMIAILRIFGFTLTGISIAVIAALLMWGLPAQLKKKKAVNQNPVG